MLLPTEGEFSSPCAEAYDSTPPKESRELRRRLREKGHFWLKTSQQKGQMTLLCI